MKHVKGDLVVFYMLFLLLFFVVLPIQSHVSQQLKTPSSMDKQQEQS
jgi:hypothetical protein